MKRRQFIRNIGLAGLSHGLVGKALASEACCTLHSPAIDGGGSIPSLKLLQSLSLTEFTGEQEENPCLVTDGKDGSWLFSLRRLPYPKSNELISCFSLSEGEWIEQDPVFSESGEYEAVTASCAPGGEPAIAWSCKEGSEWTIMVSRKIGKEFGYPRTFRAASGRYINPVLISPAPGRHWLAWECYEMGELSIRISKFDQGTWSAPVKLAHAGKSLMDPAMAEAGDGSLYIAYGITDGVHQNIEMKQLVGNSMKILKTVPVAIGGS